MRLVTALVVSLSSFVLAQEAVEPPKLVPGERPTEGTDRLKSIGDFYARLDSMAKRLPELTPEFFAADDQYGTAA